MGAVLGLCSMASWVGNTRLYINIDSENNRCVLSVSCFDFREAVMTAQ